MEAYENNQSDESRNPGKPSAQKMTSNDSFVMSKPVEFIHHHDVLVGKSTGILAHPGNKTFRIWANEKKLSYIMSKKNSEKNNIARSIIDQVHGLKPKGRFLVRCDDRETSYEHTRNISGGKIAGKWVVASHSRAMDKTRQALREGATNIKKKGAQSETLHPQNKGPCNTSSNTATNAAPCTSDIMPIESLTSQQLKCHASESIAYAATMQTKETLCNSAEPDHFQFSAHPVPSNWALGSSLPSRECHNDSELSLETQESTDSLSYYLAKPSHKVKRQNSLPTTAKLTLSITPSKEIETNRMNVACAPTLPSRCCADDEENSTRYTKIKRSSPSDPMNALGQGVSAANEGPTDSFLNEIQRKQRRVQATESQPIRMTSALSYDASAEIKDFRDIDLDNSANIATKNPSSIYPSIGNKNFCKMSPLHIPNSTYSHNGDNEEVQMRPKLKKSHSLESMIVLGHDNSMKNEDFNNPFLGGPGSSVGD